MTFRIGQKVVCVDAGEPKGAGAGRMTCPLSEGEVYTILDIRSGAHRRFTGLSVDGDPGIFWGHIRFRPVVERETDISIFHEILRTTKAPVNADARCCVGSHEEKSHG